MSDNRQTMKMMIILDVNRTQKKQCQSLKKSTIKSSQVPKI